MTSAQARYPRPVLPQDPPRQRAVGLVAPFDLALDRELWRWVPDDVSLLFARTPFVDEPVNLTMLTAVSDHEMLRDTTRQVLAVAPEVVAYACTSGSFIAGVQAEQQLREVMRQGGAPDAVTTSGGLLEALRAVKATRLALATPYTPEVTRRLHVFLAEAGVDVVRSTDLGLSSRIWQLRYEQVADLILAADDERADAVFVSCTNVPTYDIISPLERHLGKPVLTANQVTMWAALARLGLTAVGPGQQLLATSRHTLARPGSSSRLNQP
jgi:maleate isomerase